MRLNGWLAAAGVLGATCAVVAGAIYIRSVERRSPGGDGTPQCGHWSVLRCCELLGAPVEMPALMQLLPARQRGHNMLELAQVFEQIGLETEGRRETLEGLADASSPCIAHMTNPFVVVAGVEKDRVHVFDGQGRRRTRSVKTFQAQWGGEVLCVRRKPGGGPLAPQPAVPSPRIRFDTLLIDKGDIPATSQPAPYVYRFRNLGNADLVIEEVKSGCTCLKVEKPAGPIAPGGEGRITLLYHVTPAKGPFVYATVVRTNDAQLPQVSLQAAGNTDTEVVALPGKLDLGEIAGGREHAAVCFVRYRGDAEDFTVEQATCSLAGAEVSCHATVSAELARHGWRDAGDQLTLPPGTMAVCWSFTPPSDFSGPVADTLVIRTNIKGFEQLSIPVTARVVPPVRAFPSVLSFGEVSEERDAEQTISLVSEGSREFRVVGVEPRDSGLQYAVSDPSSTVGGKITVRFSAKASTAARLAGSTLTLRVELADGGRQVALPLPVHTWPRGVAGR